MSDILTSCLKFFRVLIPIVTACFASACSDPKFSELHQDAEVLAFGDSLTAGYGVKPEDSYPSELQRLIAHTVVNAGISGETTTQGLRRFDTLLDKEKPNFVILMEGGNDILRNQNLKQTESNLATMTKMTQVRDIQIILIGLPLKSLFSSACALFYETLSETYDIPLDCDSVGKLLRDNRYKSDTIHFNKAGYALLAERIKERMEDEGALSQ